MRNVYSAIISRYPHQKFSIYQAGKMKRKMKRNLRSDWSWIYLTHPGDISCIVPREMIPVCMLGALLTLSKFKQECSCFYFYFCFFFRFGFIFLYGLVSSSYENINSFSPSVINSVNLVNILGLQNTNERLAVAYRLKGWGGGGEV